MCRFQKVEAIYHGPHQVTQAGVACHLPSLTPCTSTTKSYVGKDRVLLIIYQKKRHTSPNCPLPGQETPKLLCPNFPCLTSTHTAPPEYCLLPRVSSPLCPHHPEPGK